MSNKNNTKVEYDKLSPEDEQELTLRYHKAERKVKEHLGVDSNLPKACNPVTMYYAVCQYMLNSPNPNERANVGIVFHIPELRYSRIYTISDYSKIKTTGTDFKPRFMDLLGSSLRSTFNDGVDDLARITEDIDKPIYLGQITKYYVNLIRFAPIESVITENYVDKMVELEEKFL